MLYESFIARRYLFSRERGWLVAIITLISVLGVAIGVCALLVVISVMDGADQDLFRKMIDLYSHVNIIAPADGGFANYDQICAAAEKVHGVKAASPAVVQQAIALHRLVNDRVVAQGVIVEGIDPDREKRVTGLNSVTNPPDLGPLQEGQIVLGSVLANDVLGVTVGDHLRLMTKVDSIVGTLHPKQVDVTVAGRLISGYYTFDQSAAYVSLEQAQKMFQTGNQATQIHIAVNYPLDLSPALEPKTWYGKVWRHLANTTHALFAPKDANPHVLDDIRAAVAPYIQGTPNIQTWIDWNQDFFKALALEKAALFIILLLVILVAAFNIIGTQILVVLQKTREVGILMSMGVPRRSIRRVFWGFGMMIGMAGTLLGLFWGLLICYFIGHTDLLQLPSAVYGIARLPVHVKGLTVSVIVICSMVICTAASVFPAWRASQLDPVEALRYE